MAITEYMAEHLASIHGTEKDRINCPFYYKIGACRHGNYCARLHNRPSNSRTLLFINLYKNPALDNPVDNDGIPKPLNPCNFQNHFENFYEDLFAELSFFGYIENLNVIDNLSDHMIGNVYIKFKKESSAMKALKALNGRFYDKRVIVAETSPVTDFRESTCRQYEDNACNRGGYCNFMHLKPIRRVFRIKLYKKYQTNDIKKEESIIS
mmetsp:Transcript_20459/g.50203  ORF Transcript_20459/g.50203 Transcript_20459/m.50203 type:complete len:209 (+) Transcript_20459:797-1423(+)